MSIISRPTKLGGSTDVVAGNDVLAEEWNGDVNGIYDDHNGNIDDSNLKSGAGLQTDKFADGAITSAKILDGAVTTAKIPDLNVTGAKVAAATLGTDKFKVTTNSVSITINIGINFLNVFASLVPRLDDSGTNWAGAVDLIYKHDASIVSMLTSAANPTVNFAKATYDILTTYIKNVVYTSGTGNITATLVYVFLTKVS